LARVSGQAKVEHGGALQDDVLRCAGSIDREARSRGAARTGAAAAAPPAPAAAASRCRKAAHWGSASAASTTTATRTTVTAAATASRIASSHERVAQGQRAIDHDDADGSPSTRASLAGGAATATAASFPTAPGEGRCRDAEGSAPSASATGSPASAVAPGSAITGDHTISADDVGSGRTADRAVGAAGPIATVAAGLKWSAPGATSTAPEGSVPSPRAIRGGTRGLSPISAVASRALAESPQEAAR